MTLHERLEDLFRSVLGDDSLRLRDDTTASEIDGWDSVANINLMFSIESEFGVQFDGDGLGAYANIGELKQFLDARTVSR